ncbi:ABC transporter permease [Lactiplantibacillus plantarum]|uniref:ABC transporter permease n=1 Tax=Lactiplantibacillus plantarum TaxID=1590 RepID=UPI000E09CCD8|nr:ABC transporter permease [Lactiplantibacillus plantarum]RDG26689.1 ABC transporter permease [Lactiplantibacillus plantarum]
MMKTLNKNIRREFKLSLGRFISVSALLMLGVFVLVGLNVTGPNMRQTAQQTYHKVKLADAKITTTLPLDQADRRYLSKLATVKQIAFGYSTDVLIKGTNQAIRVDSMPATLSKIVLTSGHKPQNSHEIVLSDQQRGLYRLNQMITFQAAKSVQHLTLKRSRFKVVGFAMSAEYLKKDNVGNTQAGNGSLGGFAFVDQQAFTSSKPNVARVTLKGLSGAAYSVQYEQQVANKVETLQDKLNHYNKHRISVLRQQLDTQIAVGTSDLSANTISLKSASDKLKAAQTSLTRQLAATRQTGNAVASNLLASQQKQLEQQRTSLNTKQAELKQAQAKITSAKAQRTQLADVGLTIQTRNDYNDGYNNYGEDAQRIDALGKAFPVFFFLIAILVSYTTMRRMVEEKRIEMGTLRALGYGKRAVMREFLVYSSLTALTGTVIGSLLGLVVLPQVIFRAYTANFTFTHLQLALHPEYIAVSLVITFLSTVLASWLAARQALKTIPAQLMLPKPPAKGSRILLERLTLIWRRLSFSHKVTARNLFRYKGRMLMTIIGVAGATALMITGFGIRDSLNTIVTRQFEQISRYDLITVYNPKATTHNVTRVKDAVTDSTQVKAATGLYFANVYATRPQDYAREQIALIVPNRTNSLARYIKLRDSQTGKQLHFSDKGAIVSEKLAKLQQAAVGDHITLHDSDGTAHRIKITGITQMYAGHYVLMNQHYYQQVYGQTMTNNAYLIKLKQASKTNTNRFAAMFNRHSAAVQTVQSRSMKTTITNILNNLNNLIIVLVLSASLLSLVVLYTLTNINVSERIRELATLKVLGFYPREVLMYIYRETTILTATGIIVGLGVGYSFHAYIMALLPPATAMVAPGLSWLNVLISITMTVIFSLIVMMMMNRKIQDVDMLGALKSVD